MSNAGWTSVATRSPVMEKASLVQVIGRGTKVKFVLDPLAPAELLEPELRTFLGSTHGWFAGGEVVVDAGVRVLNVNELQRLRSIFEDEYKVNVATFECPIDVLQDTIRDVHNVPVSLLSEERVEAKPPPAPPSDTLFVRSNCRSGSVVEHPGDVVIFGNVNPGAKIMADGDVVVIGSLKGTVQAGTNDAEDSEASIIAMDLGTARLQIGTRLYQHTPGKAKKGEVPLPVIARVLRGGVEVMPFAGSFRRRKER